jgi:hypothetical protein
MGSVVLEVAQRAHLRNLLIQTARSTGRFSVVIDIDLRKNPTPIQFDETLWPTMIEVDMELARYFRTNAERYAMWLKKERQRGQ